MRNSFGQADDGGDPSFDPVNINLLLALRGCRSRPFTQSYNRLVEMVGDPYIAEMMWMYYGEDAIATFDAKIDALNDEVATWLPWFKKVRNNTIRDLMASANGKRRVWQMLHDAAAWLM